MAGSRGSGPLGSRHNTPVVDSGTLTRSASPLPQPVGAKIDSSIVLAFRAITLVPIDLRAFGAGFKMGGRFRIHILLNPSVNCSHYQYRQFIKGTATLQQGTFVGTPHTLANWRPTGPLYDAKNDFAIPGGLQTHFTEDGEIVAGQIQRFGYRSAAAIHGTDKEDRYVPSQKSGCEYRAIDTYGLSGISRPVGLRIHMRIMWQGRVIDTTHRDRILKTLHWKVEKDDIII